MCAIMVVLQLMLPRDSLSNMVSLLSLQSNKNTLENTYTHNGGLYCSDTHDTRLITPWLHQRGFSYL